MSSNIQTKFVIASELSSERTTDIFCCFFIEHRIIVSLGIVRIPPVPPRIGSIFPERISFPVLDC